MRYFFMFLLLSLPVNAYAYLDPGTGSYIIQMLIAVFLGGLYAVKIYWQKIKLYFSKFFSKGSEENKQK